MICGLHTHPENPLATRAFELVRKGQCEQAVTVLTVAGYADPEGQVKLILDFIAHCTRKPKTQTFRRRKRNR